MTIDQPLHGTQERKWAQLLAAAADLVVLEQLASVNLLQRRLEISLDRASTVYAALQQYGVIAAYPMPGSSRYVQVTPNQLPDVLDRIRRDHGSEAVP